MTSEKTRLARIIGCALTLVGAHACVQPEPAGEDGGPQARTLTIEVEKTGDGLGAVVSVPDGLECASDCAEGSHAFAIGGSVALVATPARDALFAGWTCEGDDGSTWQSADDTVVASTPENEEGARVVCQALFRRLLTVLVLFSGEGAGRVTGTLVKADGVTPRIDCASDGSGDCTSGYLVGEEDTLVAAADEGDVFVSWALDCGSGTGPATLVLDDDKDCEARFDP